MEGFTLKVTGKQLNAVYPLLGLQLIYGKKTNHV
jgi:hypothetical protein